MLWFTFACIFELAILLAAALAGLFLRHDPLARLSLDPHGAVAGLAGTLPLLGLFLLTLHSGWAPLVQVRRFLDSVVRPIFSRWSTAQLLVLSALAGIAEETLFRGLIQETLRPVVGPGAAICIGAIAFGLAHPITPAYVTLAAFAGLYLGVLYELAGNLSTPILAHACYDLVALLLFLRLTPPLPAQPPAGSDPAPY